MLKMLKEGGRKRTGGASSASLVRAVGAARAGWCRACRADCAIVLTGEDFYAAWCASCVSRLDLIELDCPTGKPLACSRVIRRWVHDARMHLFETAEGTVMLLRVRT